MNGHQQQQQVRRQVAEHHRIEQAEALGHPRRGQERERREQVRPEEERAQRLGRRVVAQRQPVGHQALHDEPARKSVEPLQSRELQHDPARAPQAERRAGALGRLRRRPVARRQPHVERGEHQARHAVGHEHRALRVELGSSRAPRRAEREAGGHGARGRAGERHQVVPGEGAHGRPASQRPRQQRVLERRERARVLPVGAERAEHGAHDEQQRGSRPWRAGSRRAR